MQLPTHPVKRRTRCVPLRLLALALFTAALAGVLPPGAGAATGPLRLSGSFIQYWDEMQTWPAETWHAVLDSMKAAKMNTVIIQMLVYERNDGSLRSFISPGGQADATEIILNYADANGFRVYLGLYMPNWNHDMIGSSFLLETQSRMATVAQQAWDRYLSGKRHPSFAGWYIPYEPWTADYLAAEVTRLRSFFQSIDESCQLVAGDMPLAISPFINSYRPSPCRVEQVYRELLDQSGLDILLLQDSVGAQQWETGIAHVAGPYFEAFRNACRSAGLTLWANLESFRITNGVYGPCDAARLRRQFDAAGPYVEDFVTFDFVHYMNPVSFLSSWDQARRTQMQQLYADYKAAFSDGDYAPFAPPVISGGIAEDRLVVKWRGQAGDQFLVQTNTNLVEGAWSPLDTPVHVEGSQFSISEPLNARAPARWFRVQKLPSLQVPDSMVYIPPGTFVMGTPADDPNRTAQELPQFQVTLTHGFWMSRFEVTQSDYQNVMCTNPSSATGDLARPVDRVQWRKAMDYCAAFTQRERQALRLPEGFVYRLPTEAEWEYAARGGTTNRFGFGDDPMQLAAYAWFSTNSQSSIHRVGERQPTAWGLHDMHGNVFEWCWDWISSAPAGPVNDLVGAANDSQHAVRGGAATYPWYFCRAGWRNPYSTNASPVQVGFRVMLAPSVP